MRRLLLIGAASASLLLAPRAHAQMAVFDAKSFGQLVQQLQQAQQLLVTAKEQFSVAVSQFQSFNHLTSMGQLMPGLMTQGLTNPLPGTAQEVQGLLTGAGGGGALSSLMSGILRGNTVYTPTDPSWMSQHIIQDGRSIAGAQALSEQLYQSMATRIPMMQQLASQLQTASDPKDVMDLQARLASEQAIVQSQQAQAQTLTTWYTAQTSLMQQQVAERRVQEADEFLHEASSNGVNVGQ